MKSATHKPRSVAVVIGSGSVKCAAALGLINALERAGIGIEMLVGCSAGCLYATLIASGRTTAEAAEMTRVLWTSSIAEQHDRMAVLRAMFPKLFGFTSRFGLRNDRLIMQRLHTAFGDARIEDMKIPLHLTATDFTTGEQAVFSRGRAIDAIRASIAVPFLFSPHLIDGKLYLDGYMTDPLPIGVAMREGAGVIVAMGFESPYQEKVSSVGRFAFQVSAILSNNLLKSQFAFHGLAHHAEIISIIPRFTQRIRLFDTEKIPYIIEEGERAAEEQMPYLDRLLSAQDERKSTSATRATAG
ncbi:MAG TPA: patatin-like phospholipase family protein [Casimicrobiaceae bacterium]|nr:patatin-like phospholipase family protein [Casimicrobiaceae bacterium]